MADCASIDRIVTPFVDGELAAADHRVVEEHLGRCAACRSRIEAERGVRQAIGRQRPRLLDAAAPQGLRVRCAQVCGRAADADRRTWQAPAAMWALATSLAILIGGFAVNHATQTSVRVMAAELAADHMKCALLNAVLDTDHQHAEVAGRLAAGFGWETSLPEGAGLELVGARTCLYGQGRVAHLMYRDGARLVSVYMLPGAERPEDLVSVLGHREAVWSSGGRTFVLVARQPEAEVARLASFMRATLR
jgi:anti-sigma factor RsiW